MNRKQTIIALMTMAKKIAEQHGCDIVTTKGSTNGLWDSTDFTGWHKTMGEYLTEKYGKMEETHFTDVPYEDYDLRKDFKVSFEYRFSNPKICVGTQWGKGGYASAEFSPRDKENDTDYELSEILIFKQTGIKYSRIIMDYWREARKEKGEDPWDWKEDD